MFLRCARYSSTARLVSPRMLFGCGGGGCILSVRVGSIKPWDGLNTLLQNQIMAVSSVMALVAIRRLTEID